MKKTFSILGFLFSFLLIIFIGGITVINANNYVKMNYNNATSSYEIEYNMEDGTVFIMKINENEPRYQFIDTQTWKTLLSINSEGKLGIKGALTPDYSVSIGGTDPNTQSGIDFASNEIKIYSNWVERLNAIAAGMNVPNWNLSASCVQGYCAPDWDVNDDGKLDFETMPY